MQDELGEIELKRGLYWFYGALEEKLRMKGRSQKADSGSRWRTFESLESDKHIFWERKHPRLAVVWAEAEWNPEEISGWEFLYGEKERWSLDREIPILFQLNYSMILWM